MYPSTNNALERNNGILKQYYTNRTRQSVPALVKKLGEFLKDQVNLDKELQEVKLNHEDLKLAEAFLDKHTDYFAEKDLRRKRTLDYDNFDQFKSDSRALLFVEKVQINNDQVCCVCSCEQSMKGKDCIHALAVLL